MDEEGFPRTPPDAQLRADAEAELARRPHDEQPARSATELLHELQVHQIELEMQNDALRQAQLALEESRDHYLDLYEFAPVGYLSLSSKGLIERINLTGAALLGEERGRLHQHRFACFVAEECQDRWRKLFLSSLQQSGRHRCDLSMQRLDGHRFFARLDCLCSDAETVRIILSDITEQKQAEEALRIAAIAFETQEAMMVTDAHGIIVRVNQAFTRLTGYSAAEVIGQTPALLRSDHHDEAFYQQIEQALKGRAYWQGEIWNRRKDGTTYAEWLTLSAVLAPDGTATHYVGTFSEFTQNKEAEAEIHRLAYYDPLTQLPNRRLLHDRIGQAFASSARSGQYGALLFLDLDHFKNFNDTLGHAVGDQLLTEAARRIRDNVREGDTVARLGGDEFVVMLEDLSVEVQEAAIQTGLVAEKIREVLALPYDLDGHETHCPASLGATLFRNHEESMDAVLRHADLAMYKAKNSGRNTLRFFDPAMQTSLDERSALESDLRLALERGQLHLYYQAQMDGERRITGAEALLRWEHPERGWLLPDGFIPLAEETGLILPIGRWVLETACAQLKAWSVSPATRALRLAVNVSARQFRQPEFVAQFSQALSEAGVEPTRLKIELTEGQVIDGVDDAIAKMQALRALGVGFSLDNFGTGFSSLSYLTRLPLEQLKIDRSFIRDLPDGLSDAAIVQTIITMGKILGLDVIAEGVETEAQRECLAGYGCLASQGFLFARPLPLTAFEALLRQDTGA